MSEGDVVSFKPKADTAGLDAVLASNSEEEVHNYIMNPDNAMEDKVDALEHLDGLLGMDSGFVTPRDVSLYIQAAENEGRTYEPPAPETEKLYPDSWVDGPDKPNLKIVK